jgi:hypothetical protein
LRDFCVTFDPKHGFQRRLEYPFGRLQEASEIRRRIVRRYTP